jgi:hypothetical protein
MTAKAARVNGTAMAGLNQGRMYLNSAHVTPM